MSELSAPGSAEAPPAHHVIEQFFFDASAALADMAARTATLATELRNADVGAAQGGLVLLTNELKDFVVLVSTLRGPLAIDERRLVVAGVTLDVQLANLSAWLDSMINAQLTRDWAVIARVLECDLEPFLRAWAALLFECRGAQPMPIQ